jgi:formylglycine-generating enzyme required for sulfatase activity
MKLRVIPAGAFDMGISDEQIKAEEEADLKVKKGMERKDFVKQLKASGTPQHRVTLTRSYALGETEVTVGQFRKFVEATGYKTECETNGKGGFGRDAAGNWKQAPEFNWKNTGIPMMGDEFPVFNVTWNDANAFCKWLSQVEGKTYRLPTEAEWEFACRAGTTTPYYWGTTFGSANVTLYARRGSNRSDLDFLPVGQLRPNAFGLFDMCGNEAERCQDKYAPYTADPLADPPGPDQGTGHVLRGGSVHDVPWASGSTYRQPGLGVAGFRVVMELERE